MEKKEIKILVAEDETIQRNFIDMVLKSAGYKATLVKDGKEALEHLRKHTPDLMIFDVNMPYLSGIDLCSRTKSIRRLRDIPVIILTAQDDERTETTAKISKADIFLSKPFKSAELIATVRKELKKAYDRVYLTLS